MSIAENTIKSIKDIFRSLTQADEVQSQLPLKIRLEVDAVSRCLTAMGPRNFRRAGAGMEFYEARPFRDGDDPKDLNARLSLQQRTPMVALREAEIAHHIYMWSCRQSRMDYVSEHLKRMAAGDAEAKTSALRHAFTKGQAAEIMMLALAQTLCRNGDSVGVLDVKGTHRGGNAAQWMERKLREAELSPQSDMPVLTMRIPRQSTVLLFSDFIMDTAEISAGLDRLRAMGISGSLVMVLDPAEVTFEGFRGRVELSGMDGGEPVVIEDADADRKDVQDFVARHIEKVRSAASAKGFGFIMQRTDRPLHEALLKLYGLPVQQSPVRAEGVTP